MLSNWKQEGEEDEKDPSNWLREAFLLKFAPKITTIACKLLIYNILFRIPNPGAAGSIPAWSTNLNGWLFSKFS